MLIGRRTRKTWELGKIRLPASGAEAKSRLSAVIDSGCIKNDVARGTDSMVKRWINGSRIDGTWMSLSRMNALLIAAVLVAAGVACSAQSADKMQWVGTWETSPMVAQGGFAARAVTSTTLREIVHISNGGEQIRVRFTNEYGTDPLTISDAHAALSAGGGAIKDGTDHAVTFGGASSVRIAPGAEVFSDPVALAVQPLSDVAISFYVPNQVMRAETYHSFADQDNYMATGDVAGAATLSDAMTVASWYFVDGVDVPAADGARAIVTLGDSITDGAHSTINTNQRWPDVLAARLKQEHGLENVSVLNAGIGGNRVLNEGAGPSALSRLYSDVLAQDGVKYVIVLESINDIGRLARLSAPEDTITAAQLEFGLLQIANAAHEHGIKAIGATLTPYGGAGYSSDKGEQVLEEVNNWIRTSGTFDGVVDFDQITRDPQNPKQFNPAYDSGDHLHPNDAGYKAMADGIDLKLFKK
jgi:lysophospholipase L1-like esterase